MKVLKRPMFKYGGDVKRQGIMHGMNGLRDGGVATTMADATGYANGGMTMFPPMRGRVTRPGGYAGVENFYRPELDERPYANQFPVPQKKEMSLKDKIFRPAPNPINLPGPSKIDRSNPQVVADLEAVDGDVQKYYANQNEKNKIAEEKSREEAKSIFAPSGVYEYDREEGPVLNPDKKIDQGEITADGYGNKSKSNLPRVTSNKEKDADRLKRIYDIMGVDEAKKDAVYNSLIDLSQAQAIDTKDISGSINRAVGALSRRADKVTDLKDKGKAALASGTIQDMFKDKTSQYLKNARDYADLKGISLEKAYEQLGLVKKGGLGGQYIDYSGKQGTGLASSEDTLASFMSGQEGYKDNVLTKKEFKEAVKEGKYTSPIDVIIKENITEDGLYKIGMSVIRVKDGKPSYEINRQ